MTATTLTGLPPECFVSKRDAWLVAVLWGASLAAIDSIEPSRNALSSPACSLDRLLISYGKKRIMISPDDKAGFLRALAQRAPQLGMSGESARRG